MTLPMNIIKPGFSVPALAGAAISQFDCVKLDSTEGQVIKTAAANEAGIGFVNYGEASASGEHIDVYTSGIVWGRTSSGAASLGDYLEATADGEVTTETPANGVDQNIVGKAWGASAGDNELIPVQILIFKYNNESV